MKHIIGAKICIELTFFMFLKQERRIFTPVFSAWNGDSGAKSLVIRFQ
jgi:hypothetical protein